MSSVKALKQHRRRRPCPATRWLCVAGGRGSRLMEPPTGAPSPRSFSAANRASSDFALSNALNSGIRRHRRSPHSTKRPA